MEENILAITGELHERLARIMERKRFPLAPLLLCNREDGMILIGKATKEQRAIASLYSQVKRAHTRMHEKSGTPMGVNPDVDFDHFKAHVMQPILFEMLRWSVHRAFPDRETKLNIRFDRQWNMYGTSDRYR